MYETSTILLAFGLTVLAGLATGVGGAIGVMRPTTSHRFLATALGFSAGVMIYVSLMEILPKGMEALHGEHGDRAGMWAAVGAFFAGMAVTAVIDRLVPGEVNPHEPKALTSSTHHARRRARMMKAGTLTAVALALHNFPEGFATFIAALNDATLALPIVLAIAIHNIPEGIAVAVPLREATGSRLKAWGWATASGLAEPLGALVGFLLLMPVVGPAAMGYAFAAVAGVMVFIAIDELMPTAQETGEHHAATYGMMAGMAVMAISLVALG